MAQWIINLIGSNIPTPEQDRSAWMDMQEILNAVNDVVSYPLIQKMLVAGELVPYTKYKRKLYVQSKDIGTVIEILTSRAYTRGRPAKISEAPF